ncbi:MAG: membrane protein insertase YidC, partial [Rhodoplanes sp.]
MSEHKNTILAIVLSGAVLLIWQYFFGLPQMEKQRQEALQRQQQQTQQVQPTPAQPAPTQPTPQASGGAPAPGGAPAQSTA